MPAVVLKVIDDREYVCEAHRWLPFNHDGCPGPGIHKSELDDLHNHTQLISNEDYDRFLALLFAAGRAGVLEHESPRWTR
jgi:hypothetical protein